jgi:hypothetical protein
MASKSNSARMEALDAIARDAAQLVVALAEGDLESATDACTELHHLLEEAGYLQVHPIQ